VFQLGQVRGDIKIFEMFEQDCQEEIKWWVREIDKRIFKIVGDAPAIRDKLDALSQ
jgi:hypothetical protein